MRIFPAKILLIIGVVSGCILTGLQLKGFIGNAFFAWTGTGLMLAAAIDLAVSVRFPRKVEFKFPELVRMAKFRPATVDFEVVRSGKSPFRLKIGLALAQSTFSSIFENVLPAGIGKSRISWPLTGNRLGSYPLEKCCFSVSSYLGLWELVRMQDIQCGLNVYPDLFRDKNALNAILTGTGLGKHIIRAIGKGREFERLREYLPGDSYEDIHWKATARRGAPVTKIYQLEKTQDVYVMIDASRLSARVAGNFMQPGDLSQTSGETVLEMYIQAALSLCMAAQHQGDKIGIGVFTDRMEHFLKAGSRTSHFNLCRETLFSLTPKPVTPDFRDWIAFTGNQIRKRSLVVVLTSLDEPALAKNLMDHIHILNRRHLVMVNTLEPAAAQPIFSSQEIENAGDIYTHLSGHMQWSFFKEFETALTKKGVGFARHKALRLTADIISQYLSIKKRQMI